MTDQDEVPPERLDPERVEDLYARARAQDPATRAAFLAEACAGDQRLQEELLSLLAVDERAEHFFTNLASAVGSPTVGLQVGRYRLLGLLGAGGMGTVYRAHDQQLDRVVALKFLPHVLIAQPHARARFLQEARAAASLEHPNICSIHEIGETADGRPFIAMACYAGESLQNRLSRGPLPPADAIAIALQLARGLGAAHARGIIHRDVKPGNVMLLPDGTARLLDFGIAKLADATLTGPGPSPGTIAYMSPEQARGEPVDARSDLWSLGVVLYEMISGVRPFRGGTDGVVLEALVHEPPAPLSRQMPDTPRWLVRTIERLLEKAPGDRYQDSTELIREFEQVAHTGVADTMRHWRLYRRAILAGAAVVAVLLLAWGWSVQHRPAAAATADSVTNLPTVAVMPFTVRGPNLEIWREGMVDLLSMGLDGAAGIRTVDSRTLLARWHQAVGDQPVSSLALALDVARERHAQFALVGSAVATGTRIRLATDIYDVATAKVVGPVQVEGSIDSVLTLVDRLGMQALTVILERQPGDVSALDLAKVTTSSLLALKAYLEGEGHHRRSEYSQAIHAWESAVQTDTLFALAYLGLADAYAWTANYDNSGHGKFLQSLDRAMANKQRLPPRERATAEIRWAREHGGTDVLATTQDAIRRYPDAADLWYDLGEIYYHDAEGMGRPDDALKAFRNAAELRPDMAPYRAHLVDIAFAWRPDSAEIVRELEAYARLTPADPRVRAGRLIVAMTFGDSAAARRARLSLDLIESETAAKIYFLLAHPSFRRLRDNLDPLLAPHLAAGDRIAVANQQFKTLGLVDGRVRKALAMLDDPLVSLSLRHGGAFYLAQRGIPIPDQVLKQKVIAALTDNSLFASRVAALSAADAAAQLGEWKAYDTLMTGMRARSASAHAGGDSTGARYWDWAVRVAEAHGAWRHGHREEALKTLEAQLPLDNFRFTLWSVAQLSLDLGKTDLAERAFRALWEQDGTPAYLQLARILERSGRRIEAREAYQFVVDAWRDADPELQPLVEEARRAVTRLLPSS